MLKKPTDQKTEKQTEANATELTLEDLEKVQGGTVASSRSDSAPTYYVGYIVADEDG